MTCGSSWDVSGSYVVRDGDNHLSVTCPPEGVPEIRSVWLSRSRASSTPPGGGELNDKLRQLIRERLATRITRTSLSGLGVL